MVNASAGGKSRWTEDDPEDAFPQTRNRVQEKPSSGSQSGHRELLYGIVKCNNM